MVNWTETGSSSANSAVTVTHAAATSTQHFVSDVTVSFRGASAGNDIRVEIRDGSTVKWDTYIDAVRGLVLQEHFSSPIEISTGAAVNVVVAAGGSSVIATVNVGGYSKSQ